MEKEFIPYGLALRMKQLEFDEPCFGYWYTEQEEYKKIDMQLATIDFLEGEPDYVLAPTWQQAFRWFREKGYLISFSSHDDKIHDFYIKRQPSKSILSDTYDTYGEAELACLEKLIEIVEQKEE
jgi:hypothetical protein